MLSPRGRTRHRDEHRDERGAVAVLVTLVVVLVLIPTAALAMDVGNVYLRRSTLQQAADDAALAGAKELAVQQRLVGNTAATDAARERAIGTMCADAPPLDPDPWHRPCTGDHAWASDGDLTNGEVVFYAGAPAGWRYPDSQISTGTGLLSGIRVVTPPSRVEYGLASIAGVDHATPQEAATAALRTALPVKGYLPLATVQSPPVPGAPQAGEAGPFCARSGPRSLWLAAALTGSCGGDATTNPAAGTIARGYLDVPRSDGRTPAAVWNTAVGFDHPVLPGQYVTLHRQDAPYQALDRDLTGADGSTGGFFGSSGRLVATPACPGGHSATTGTRSGVEGAHLADFVDTGLGGTLSFLSQITTANLVPSPSQAGWLRPGILRCGRLAVVPEISLRAPFPLAGLAPTSTNWQVTRLRLVWLDNEFAANDPGTVIATDAPHGCLRRGFYWADPNALGSCTNPLRAITGFVLDPRLLPATVSAADAVNPIDYLGSGLPATTKLIHDAWDQPAS